MLLSSGPASSSSPSSGEGNSVSTALSLPLFQAPLEVGERGRVGRVPDGGSVMTGSAPQLGVLLLLAVLLQTVVVTITVLHFTTALNSVRSQCGFGTADARSARAPSQCQTDDSLGGVG